MSVKDVCELGALMEAEEADNVNLEAEIIRAGGEIKTHQQRYLKEKNILFNKIKEYSDQEDRYQDVLSEFALYDVSNLNLDPTDYTYDSLSKQVEVVTLELRDIIESFSLVDSNIQKMEASFSELEERATKLRAEKDFYDDVRENTLDNEKALQNLKDSMDIKRIRIERLDHDEQEQDKVIADKKVKLEEGDKEVKHDESLAESLRGDILEIEKRIADIEATSYEREHNLKLDLKSADEKKLKLEEELRRARSTLASTEKELATHTQEKSNINDKLISVQTKLDDVKTERLKRNERTISLALEMRTLQESKTRLMIDSSAMPLELERVKLETQEISSQAQNISTQLSEKKLEIKAVKEAIEKKKEADKLKEEYDRQVARKSELQEELNKIQRQNAEAATDLEQTETQLAIAERDVQNLELELKDIKEKTSKLTEVTPHDNCDGVALSVYWMDKRRQLEDANSKLKAELARLEPLIEEERSKCTTEEERLKTHEAELKTLQLSMTERLRLLHERDALSANIKELDATFQKECDEKAKSHEAKKHELTTKLTEIKNGASLEQFNQDGESPIERNASTSWDSTGSPLLTADVGSISSVKETITLPSSSSPALALASNSSKDHGKIRSKPKRKIGILGSGYVGGSREVKSVSLTTKSTCHDESDKIRATEYARIDVDSDEDKDPYRLPIHSSERLAKKLSAQRQTQSSESSPPSKFSKKRLLRSLKK